MGMFGGVKRRIPGFKTPNSRGGGTGQNGDDFDFDSLEDMSDEFSDDHNVSTDRKATIKNYVTEHYENKFTDRGERKKLIKQALPPSYSGPVDLAYDLKDDYDSIKYEVSKEVEKLKSPLKKALKSYKPFVKFVPFAGKRALEWAEQEERNRYQEEEANQDEALVQSMLAEFTNPQVQKEQEREQLAEKKLRQTEREDAADYREKSLTAQMQGVAASGNVVAELRKMTNYQDQVTFLYQKKSLEVGIRSLLEHRKQTDILRVYKEEAIAELKEIHKNTGLPEVVKTNNSEVASQIFKERMIGKAATWFDGKLGTIRKRITTRIRDKLIETARDMGSNLTAMNEAVETAQEGGDSAASFAAKMGADQGLDWLWNRTTRRPLNWIRGKMQGNGKIARWGKGLSAITNNLGDMVNSSLLENSTGNKLADKVADWFGLRSTAVTRDDTIRQSLSKNLDTAAYMDQKFKQTVERVIPHWLSLIYKENHLMRMGWGFKEGDGKDGTIKFEEKVWDWNEENLVNKKDQIEAAKSKIFDKGRIESYTFALSALLTHIGIHSLSSKGAQDAVKNWVIKRAQDGKACGHYEILTKLHEFPKKYQDDIKYMVHVTSGLLLDQIEEDVETGMFKNMYYAMQDENSKYAVWLNRFGKLSAEFKGKSLIDWNALQELVNNNQHEGLIETGALIRNEDGSISANINFETAAAKKLANVQGQKAGVVKYKVSGQRSYTDARGKKQQVDEYEIDEQASNQNYEDVLDGRDLKLSRSTLKFLESYVNHEKLMTSRQKDKESLQNARIRSTLSRASGGFIESFAKGGRARKKKYGKMKFADTAYAKRGGITSGDIDEGIPAILHGGEFVSDAQTTAQNAELLSMMNKLKASVINPDGSINPVYYKAFGFKDAKEMDASLAGAESSYKSKQTVRQIQKTGAWAYIETLFNSIDASKLSNEELTALTDGKSSSDSIIKLLAAIKEKQEKKSASQVAAGGISTAIKWFNKDRSGSKAKGKDLAEKTKKAGKSLLKDMEKDLGKYSEEQAEPLFWEIAAYTDPKLISEETMLYFEDANVSWKDKVKKISMINYQHGDKADFVKKAMQGSAKKLATKTGLKLKNFINGSETDTTNTDELKKIGGKFVDKVKRLTTRDLANEVGKGLKFNVKIGQAENAKLVTVFTAKQMRQGLVWMRTGDAELGVAFVKSFADVPLTPQSGDYIFVLKTTEGLKEADYLKPKLLMQLSHPMVHLENAEPDEWFDTKGNRIDVAELAEKEKTLTGKTDSWMSKSSRDMLVDKAMDKMRVKKAYDLAMKFYDGSADAVDIYLLGSTESPRLTAVGFVNGDYIDKNTGRVCSSHHDITGPVSNAKGDVLLTPSDLQKGFCDKEGNPITVNVLKRYRNIAKEEATKLYNKYGKKHVDRLSKGMLTLTEKWQNMFRNTSVDVYVGDEKEPRLTIAGFTNGEYLSATTKKPLSGWDDIDGPVMARDGVYIITQKELESKPLIDKDGNTLQPPKLLSNMQRLKGIMMKALGVAGVTKFAKKGWDKAKGFYDKRLAKKFAGLSNEAVDVYVDGQPVLLAIDFKAGKLVDKDGKPLANHYQINGPVYKLKDDGTSEIVLSQEMLEKGGWTDAEGKPLPVTKAKQVKGFLKQGLRDIKASFMEGFKGKEKPKPEDDVESTPVNKDTVYYKDPMTGALLPVFTIDNIKNGQVYTVDPHSENPDSSVSKITSFMYLQKGVSVYVITDLSSLKEGTAITYDWLNKNAQCVCSSAFNSGKWFDWQGKKLSAKSFSKLETPDARSDKKAGGLKGKLMSWKDKAKSMLSGGGEETTDKDGKPVRKGSWQEKLANKTKDSWIGKLAGAFGFGKKDKDGKGKKKSWLGKILGGVALLGGTITKALFGLGGLFTKGLFSLAGMVVKPLLGGMAKLAGWIVSPLIKGLGMLGTKIMTAVKGNGLMGKFGGKALRIAGAAGGAYMAYQGLKGQEKLDENGNPVLDENGKPVVERNYGQAALGAGMAALSIPGAVGALGGAAGAVGGGLAAAAGFLAPIALPLAATAAVGYGAYKAFGWWKKASAKKDYPITAFRINQYGFDMTDQTVMETIMKLEATLQPNVVFSGDKANFKNDIDVESIFAIFGLKFQGGDGEKNKRFLTWFLGRFKPVYIAYVRAMKSVKNTTDLNDMEKKLTPVQALQVLDKVHFKNQSDLNPYNIMVSPFDDPDECDYDFDDISKRYEDVKELLTERSKYAIDGDKSLDEAKEAEDKDPWTVKGALKTAFKYSPAGAAIWAIKKSGQGIKDALSWVSDGLGKTFSGMWDKFTGIIGEKWQSFKNTVKDIWGAISNPIEFAKKLATGAIDAIGGEGTTQKAVDATSSAIEYGANAAASAGTAISNVGSAISTGWNKLTGKTAEMQKAVFNSFLRAGLSPNQAKAITAEVGRENDYNANTIFGTHVDPASGGKSISNLGMISWNGPRGKALAERLKAKGLLDANGKMVQSQEALDVQTQFAVDEMKGSYAKRLTNFWGNPNGDPNAMAPELGKNYVVWAYGQTKLKNGKDFNWKEHDEKRRKYLQAMDGLSVSGASSSSTTPATTTIAQSKPTIPNTVSGGSGGGGESSAPAGDATSTTKTSTYSGNSSQAQTLAKQVTDLAKQAQAEKDPVKKKALAEQSLAASKKAKELAAQSKANPSLPATPASAAVKPAATGAANAMALAKPELIALGKTHYRLKDNKVTLAGMNETFMALFWAMLGEAKQKGCMVVQINEGVRTLAEQHRLYNLYKAGKGPLAAVPGTSRHGKGEAMDCNTVNCDELDKKGLLAKYGFSRPLMKRLASGKMTETWHIENKFVPKAGGQAPKYPQVNDPESKQNAARAPGEIGGRQSVVNTGNTAINNVVNQGGGSNTASVASAQQADSLTQSGVASILTKQLAVQTEMKSVLVEIRDHLIKGSDPKAKQELDQLKKPQSAEDIGAVIGGNIADLLANKLGLGKPAETAKPLPVISASK